MGVQIIQDDDGGFGLQTSAGTGLGEFVDANVEYVAASVNKTFFVATRRYIVRSVVGRVTVAGTDAGAVTIIVRKVPSGTVMTSGTALHTGTIDLKGTVDTNQVMSLNSPDANIRLNAEECLALIFAGVLTAATGCVSVSLCPQ